MRVQNIRTVQFDGKDEVRTLARNLFDDGTAEEFTKTVLKMGFRRVIVCICEGCRNCNVQKAVAFRSKDGKIVCVVPSRETVSARRMGRTERRIYEFLRLHPNQKFRPADLSRILNVDSRTLFSTLRHLKQKGYVFRRKGLVWVTDYQQDIANIYRLCENIRKDAIRELCKHLTLLGFERAENIAEGHRERLFDNVTLIAGDGILQVVVDGKVFERKIGKNKKLELVQEVFNFA